MATISPRVAGAGELRNLIIGFIVDCDGLAQLIRYTMASLMKFALSLALAVMAQFANAATICIDPGHPSEVGRGTTGKLISELEAVWLVAKELKPILEKQGHKVVLTKSKMDELVKNPKRAEVANRSGADLLLRLHCDAATESGFATFFPARQGTVGGVTGPSQSVITASRAYAQPFHEAAMKVLKGSLNDRGVRDESKTAVGAKQGALTGSIHSKVPVLLVEMAVLTKSNDDKFMASAKGRKLMATALAAGVKAALQQKAALRNAPE